jgi:hypothetical protein
VKKHRLPPVVELDKKGNERYIHFGLECALAGDSPGLYHRHADVLQQAAIYKTCPKPFYSLFEERYIFVLSSCMPSL